MNFNAQENLKQVNELLPVEILQQQKRLYNVAGIKKQYSEPVPNNYSFILFYGEQRIFDKINKQAELYKPLNNLNQSLYDYYSQLNINKCCLEKSKIIKSILYHWNNLIAQGHYFLTWKLFIQLDNIINELNIIQENKQKYFTYLSHSLPEALLNAWEIGLAVSQYQLEYTLGLIVAKLTEYKIKPQSIEISKIITEPTSYPCFPTIKLHFDSLCCPKELTQLSFNLINLIENNHLETGDITNSFGENYVNFLRIQNGFEGLKKILKQMNIIDTFYSAKSDYAYKKK